jgi:hypothetical protein
MLKSTLSKTSRSGHSPAAASAALLTATVKSRLSPANVRLGDLAMKKSRNWTGTANDRLGEIDPVSGLIATVWYRCTPAIKKASANDRKGDLTGPSLETFD